MAIQASTSTPPVFEQACQAIDSGTIDRLHQLALSTLSRTEMNELHKRAVRVNLALYHPYDYQTVGKVIPETIKISMHAADKILELLGSVGRERRFFDLLESISRGNIGYPFNPSTTGFSNEQNRELAKAARQALGSMQSTEKQEALKAFIEIRTQWIDEAEYLFS